MTTPTRKQLIQDYKCQPTYYGVIRITNTVNHKIFIDTVPNTKNRWAYYKMNLNNHFYVNSPLQADWETYGEDAFAFDVLWEEKTDDVLNLRQTLKKLKKDWFDRLQPFGDRGYNKPLRH